MTEPATMDLTEEQARALTDKAKGIAAELVPLVAELYRGRAWRVLGYDSWDAYRRAEFPAVWVAVDERPAVVAELRSAGMSQREIGATLSISQPTVSRDIQAVRSDDSNESSNRTTAMSGGRTYERAAPTAVEEPADPIPPAIAKQIDQRIAERTTAPRTPVMLTLLTHTGEEVEYRQPQAKATFNDTSETEGISWASWSWNPVTGCLHGCTYCYARAIAHRFSEGFPVGFTPLFHHERLDAPANTTVPAAHRGDPAWKRVFVCSMADLYGRWVPDDWIQQVHAAMLASPWWEYLLLTKFPARYVGLEFPASAWVGTSVDEQKRVRIAEDAFRKIEGVKVKWLSLEPLREPLEFSDLSMFDWVVIGAQTETRQPDGTVESFMPPWEWVCRITAQAKASGCAVHWKPNLFNGRPGSPLNEYPEG